MLRRGLALGAVFLLAVAVVLPGASRAADGSDLRATYHESSRWDTGYVGLIDLTNTSSEVVVDWTVTFDLALDTSITTWWNAQFVRAGTEVTVTPESWTKTIQPGQTITFGWQALGLSAPTNISTGDTPAPPVSTTTAPPTTAAPTTEVPTTTAPTTAAPTTTVPTTTAASTTTAPTSTSAPSTTAASTTAASTTTAATTSTSDIPPTTAAPAVVSVRPVVDCVEYAGGGQLRAYFGYVNDSGHAVDIPVGLNNGFVPFPGDRGQPTHFEPGRSPSWPNAAFSVEFSGVLTWVVDGHVAVASIASRPCITRVDVAVQWVDTNDQPISPPSGLRTFAFGAISTLGAASCRIHPTADCTYLNAPLIPFDDALAVSQGSTFFVHPTSLLPRDVRAIGGVGFFNVPSGTCGASVAICEHTIVLQYRGTTPTTTAPTTATPPTTTAPTTSTQPTTTAPTTSTTQPPTSTHAPDTTTTAPSTTQSPTSSTEAPHTTTTEAPSTTAPTTSTTRPGSTSTTAGGPTSSTSVPTTTIDVGGGASSALIVENDTAYSRSFTVECDASTLTVANASFTLEPHASKAILVNRGDYCTVHSDANDVDDTIIIPQDGASVIDPEEGDAAGRGGSWICDTVEVFVVRIHNDPIATSADVTAIGARPQSGCTIAVVIAAPARGEFPWPLVVLGGFFAALIGFALWRVSSGRDPGLDAH